ncbi:MAG: agmatinase [Nitrososphaerota archaeon]
MLDRYLNDIRFLARTKDNLLGAETPLENAEYVVFGVPYDLTSSFRPGSRYGPEAVRHFSANLESNSYIRDYDAMTAPLYDAGNLVFDYRLPVMLKRTYRLVKAIRALNKRPIMIGGEHTFTLASISALRTTGLAVIILDAHLDLRDEYLGLRLNHATYLRRLKEKNPEIPITIVGARGYDRSELEFARKYSINIIRASDITDSSESLRGLEQEISDRDVYISFDIDVLDPAYAPGVGNPEPGGLSMAQLTTIIHRIVGRRVVGFDVVEVSPLYDTGVTAAAASRLIIECLAAISGARHL